MPSFIFHHIPLLLLLIFLKSHPIFNATVRPNIYYAQVPRSSPCKTLKKIPKSEDFHFNLFIK